MDRLGEDVADEPHRAATVRDALDLLQHIARDLPQEGLFDDVVVEVRGDPGLGDSPDPELLPDPLVMHLSLEAFRSTVKDRPTLAYPRVRGLRVVVVDGDGDDGAYRSVRHGSLADVRRDLASPRLEGDVCSAFRHLAQWYCEPDP